MPPKACDQDVNADVDGDGDKVVVSSSNDGDGGDMVILTTSLIQCVFPEKFV